MLSQELIDSIGMGKFNEDVMEISECAVALDQKIDDYIEAEQSLVEEAPLFSMIDHMIDL